MFGIENGWYLGLALFAAGAFIATLGGVHIWTCLPGGKK